MKKLLILSSAALFFSGMAFAQTGDKDKKKDKKKPATTQTCPGKECHKKKDKDKS